MIAIYVRGDIQIPLMGNDGVVNGSMSFADTPYGIPSSVNIFFIEKDTQPSRNISLTLPSESPFRLVTLAVDGSPVFHSSVALSHYASDGWNIYKGIVYVCVDSEPDNVIDQLVADTLTLSIDGSPSSVSLYYNPISTNDKFIELVQNFKQTITETDMRAMYESEVDSSAIDSLLLNAKNKEILLNMMELTGYIGTYRGLHAAIAFYGYTDIITINEIWRNTEGRYAYTEAGNGITPINNRMKGFTKTGQLQLIYDINEPDGTQDGEGFNNYANLPVNTEDMLLKMYALKNILETRWLPLNSRIVDIMARHRTEAGLKLVNWSIGARSGETDMNIASQSLRVDIPLEAAIKDHSVILSKDYLIDNGTTVSYPVGSVNGLFNDTYFLVDHIIDDPENEPVWQSGLYVRRFYRGDFAVLTSKILSSDLPIISYRYVLGKKVNGVWTDVYKSNILPFSADTISIAVRDYGTFRITFFFLDGYGSMNIVSSDPVSNITISKGNTNFSLVKLSPQTYGSDRGFAIDITSVYPYLNPTATVATHVQVSPKDSTFDINQPIADNANNVRLYDILNGYDANLLSASRGVPDMYCKISSITGTNIGRMADVPMSFYGYSYANIMLDFIGDGSIGSRVMSVRIFDHKAWETVSSTYDNAAQSNKNKYINDIVVYLNSLTTGVLSRFTYSVDFFSYSLDVAERKPVIRMLAKEKGFITTKLKMDVTGVVATSKNSTFYAKFDGIANVIYGSYAVGDMVVQYTTDAKIPVVHTFTIPSLSFASKADLKAYIDNLFITTSGMDANTYDNLNNSFQIRTRQQLRISHISFGSISAAPRGESSTAYTFATTGSQYRVSEPVYAIIEDWNAFYKPFNSRMHNWNIKWTATNDITGSVESTQYGYVFRKRFFKSGSYTLKLETKDMFGDSVVEKSGSILVV